MEANVRDLWNPGEAFVPECPLCSGKVARDDPAAQALDWGVRTAEADPAQDAFWFASGVYDTYVNTYSSGKDGANLSEYVKEVAILASARSVDLGARYGEPGVFRETRRATEEMTLNLEGDKGGDRVDCGGSTEVIFGEDGRQPQPVGDSDKRICCEPEEFEYPEPGSVKRVVASLPKFLFGTRIVFSKGGDCDCTCCEFAQVVLHDSGKLVDGTAVSSSLTKGEDGQYQEEEDCAWVYVDSEGEAVDGFSAPPDPNHPNVKRGKESAPEHGLKLTGPFCVGDKGPHPLAEKNPDFGGDEDPRGFYEDPCHYKASDRPARGIPSVPSEGEATFVWEWKSEGVIVDTCPLKRNKVVSAKIMSVKVTGKYVDGKLVNDTVTPVAGETQESDRQTFVKNSQKSAGN